MSRTLVGVLAAWLVLVMATVAGAGIPDADASYIDLDNGGKGLNTCPAGDASPYRYINVIALRADLTPIQGIESEYFFFTITGSGSGNISLNAVDAETNASGIIRFEAQGTDTILYGSVTVEVQIYTTVLTDSDLLWCNTYDYEADGDVDLVDFVAFASDYGGTNERSDFDWNGPINLIDFVSFAGHFGH